MTSAKACVMILFCACLRIVGGLDFEHIARADDKPFQDLEAAFKSRVQGDIGVDPSAVGGDVAVFATRAIVATTISETVNKSHAALSYAMSQEASFVPEPLDVKTEDKHDAHLECSRDQFCQYGCDSQWPWEKAGCEIGKEVCKDSQKFDCERRKSMAQLISDKKIATVSFKGATIGGTASAANLRANVSSDLSHLVLGAALSADARLSCSGHVAPEPLVVVAGCLPHDFQFSNEPVEVKESNFELKGTLSLEPTADGIIAKIEMEEKPSVILHFAGTPVLRFIAHNPLAFLACPVPYALGGIADLVAPNDMAKRRVDLPAVSSATSVGSVSLSTNGLAFTVTPQINQKSLGLVASRAH